MDWATASIEQKLDFLKDKSKEEDFFLIWDRKSELWCVGYMTVEGLVPEMNISAEIIQKTIGEALDTLFTEMAGEGVGEGA